MGNDHKIESQKIETCVLQKIKSILKFSYRSKFSFCRRSKLFLFKFSRRSKVPFYRRSKVPFYRRSKLFLFKFSRRSEVPFTEDRSMSKMAIFLEDRNYLYGKCTCGLFSVITQQDLPQTENVDLLTRLIFLTLFGRSKVKKKP